MIAVIGASGNVGSKLSDILLKGGRKVRVIGRRADRLTVFLNMGAEAAIGSIADSGFLSGAFSGASAAFCMIPPKYDAEDFRRYQNEIGTSIVDAIEKAGVGHVVNLSSQGAEIPEGTGPIKGLHDQEHRLNCLEGINVLHLRAAFFMENLLAYVDMIKAAGFMGAAIRADLKFPMIATRDIAAYAARRLVALDFEGNEVKDLLGQRDVSMAEAAGVIGGRIGRPGLKYVQFSYDDAREAMVSAGLSPDVSGQMVEMAEAINEGRIGRGVKRTPDSTTGTSIEEFSELFERFFGP